MLCFEIHMRPQDVCLLVLQSLLEVRKTAIAYEAQAQEGLAQTERLKDLLEESARWDLPATLANNSVPGGEPNGHSGENGNVTSDSNDAPGASPAVPAGMDARDLTVLCQRLHGELMLQRAKTAERDLQVRALCLELTRSVAGAAQLQRAVGPVLSGVESRLAAVLGSMG
jgi:hypothetical protein